MPKLDADMPEDICRRVQSIEEGTVDQLKDLVKLVANRQVFLLAS